MRELDLEPGRHILGAEREPAGGGAVAAQFVAFIEDLLRPQTAKGAREAGVRPASVRGAEAILAVGGRGLHAAGAQHMIAHIIFPALPRDLRSDEHTSELQSLMRSSYAVFC